MPVQTKKKAKPAPRTTRKAAPKPAAKIPRVTYATLALTEKDHAAYDQAVEQVRARMDTHYTNYVNGQACPAQNGQEQKHASPTDTRLIVSYFPRGTREDTQAAIHAAREAVPAWAAMPYKERNKILRRAADNLIKNI